MVFLTIVEGLISAENKIIPDDVLMARTQDGDGEAFEILFDRYHERIVRHLVHIIHDQAGAQDLLQEVFLRVWTRAAQWQRRGTFQAWLYRIAKNLAFNHLRKVRRLKEQPLQATGVSTEEDQSDDTPAWMVDASSMGPDQLIEVAEQQVIFQQLLDNLSAEKQAVFRLVQTYEMTTADAADELGIPEGTVKSRLYYAKKHLASEWQENVQDQE